MFTKRQKQILDFIQLFTKKNGYSPSLEEIAKHFRLKATSTIHQHISTLESKGYLRRQKHHPRSIIASETEEMVQIPLLGRIAAGQPIEAIQDKETIAVPKSKLPRSSEVYALRVVGNSMIDENINDGDIVLVKQQKLTKYKQRVGVLINDYDKRLERFCKKQELNKQKATGKMLARKSCPICHQREDADGRCRCVNKDAW